MTEAPMPPVGDSFRPSADPNTAAARPENVGTNVCRVTTTAALMQAEPEEMAALSEPLTELGFSDVAQVRLDATGATRAIYASLAEDPEVLASDEYRVSVWTSVNESGDSAEAWRFLVALLASRDERESAAAAASILSLRSVAPALTDFELRPYFRRSLDYWPDLLDYLPPGVVGRFPPLEYEDLDVGEGEQFVPWQPRLWSDYFRAVARLLRPDGVAGTAALLADMRLRWAARSPDPITRGFAAAAGLRLGTQSFLTGDWQPAPRRIAAPIASTIVHGTRAWKGTWWRPRPENFHAYIRDNYRGSLYSGGARFSWSGALSHSQRGLAAEDLVDWVNEISPSGLETLFAHSYGGEVAAMAAPVLGNVQEVVLLSVPANQVVRDFARSGITQVVDVRLPLDPVLILVDRRQRIPGTEPVLLQWNLDHSASHEPEVWERERLAERIGW